MCVCVCTSNLSYSVVVLYVCVCVCVCVSVCVCVCAVGLHNTLGTLVMVACECVVGVSPFCCTTAAGLLPVLSSTDPGLEVV